MPSQAKVRRTCRLRSQSVSSSESAGEDCSFGGIEGDGGRQGAEEAVELSRLRNLSVLQQRQATTCT